MQPAGGHHDLNCNCCTTLTDAYFALQGPHGRRRPILCIGDRAVCPIKAFNLFYFVQGPQRCHPRALAAVLCAFLPCYCCTRPWLTLRKAPSVRLCRAAVNSAWGWQLV